MVFAASDTGIHILETLVLQYLEREAGSRRIAHHHFHIHKVSCIHI